MEEFNDLKTRNDLADFLDVPRKTLAYLLYVKKIENLYTSFEIPKKSGGSRKINAPKPELKWVQVRLAKALWKQEQKIRAKYNLKSVVSHAFEKDKSIITNAKIHRNKKIIINIDIKNFFDSFHFGRVRGFFIKSKNYRVSEDVATTIAQLCCYEGCLPQGAPTSPIVTNLICNILDIRLLKISKKYKLDYTRYADDLTFSTNDTNVYFFINEFLNEIEKELSSSGFEVNHEKTRICYANNRQEVTGLVVNEKLNVKREFYKKTRAMAYNLYSNGEFFINGKKGTISQLEGRFTFIHQLESYHHSLIKSDKKNKNERMVNCLSGRDKEYQKFLFYKYFYANSMPLVATEGKTDIVYIKAALKNLYQEYPELIEKESDGSFKFKFAFLNRTRAMDDILGIAKDGANAMKNIYNPYVGKSNYPNLWKYFSSFAFPPSNAVILLFDNEFESKNKPIKDFVKHVSLKDDIRKAFQRDGKVHLTNNLFLLMPLLTGDLKECEIEDLFDEETLSHKIGGKSFGLKGAFDREKHYSKEIFSKYVLENYESIDFENFKPLLNNLREIINSYKTVS